MQTSSLGNKQLVKTDKLFAEKRKLDEQKQTILPAYDSKAMELHEQDTELNLTGKNKKKRHQQVCRQVADVNKANGELSDEANKEKKKKIAVKGETKWTNNCPLTLEHRKI